MFIYDFKCSAYFCKETLKSTSIHPVFKIFIKSNLWSCRLRWSTWKRLQELSNGVLSAAMERLMKDDPLNPVLTKLHLTAMDRRLRFVLSSVHRCIERNGHSNVLIGDKPPWRSISVSVWQFWNVCHRFVYFQLRYWISNAYFGVSYWHCFFINCFTQKKLGSHTSTILCGLYSVPVLSKASFFSISLEWSRMYLLTFTIFWILIENK